MLSLAENLMKLFSSFMRSASFDLAMPLEMLGYAHTLKLEAAHMSDETAAATGISPFNDTIKVASFTTTLKQCSGIKMKWLTTIAQYYQISLQISYRYVSYGIFQKWNKRQFARLIWVR